MKKLLIASFFVAAGFSAFAQKLDNVTKYVVLNKFDDAKKELDKVMADPKAQDNPEALLLSARVNAELAMDSSLKNKYPNAIADAYASLNKYRSKDTSLKALKDQSSGGLRAVSIIYSNEFNAGRKFFNESKWDDAFHSFKIAEDLGDLISTHNLGTTKQKIDTFTVVYAGYAAQNAKKTDSAVYYYKKFANEKIGGKDFEDLYRYILNNALDTKNEADFKKYLAIAKELYPADTEKLWNAYEMEFMSKNASVNDMVTKYKAESAGGKLNGQQLASYGEYFANVPKEELSKLDSAKQTELKNLGSEAFEKAFNADNTNGVYAFNAGVLLYGQFNTMEDKFYNLRGESAALKAQRADVEKQQQALADKTIDLMEKSYTILKAKSPREKVETSCLSKSVDFLANLYQWKRDKARGKNPQDYDKYDAKYKQFDAEHGKY